MFAHNCVFFALNYPFGGKKDYSWFNMRFVILLVSCGSRSSSKAFIFSLYNVNGDSPVKLKVKPGYTATYTCSGYGPTFGGGHDIYIADNAASNQQSYTNCGYHYYHPQGYSCSFYAGSSSHSYTFTPSDIEVFYEATF